MMVGLPDSHDRRWLIDTGEFQAEMTDYNWEITGVDKRLHDLDPEIFTYGGNAYYVTGPYAHAKGYTVTKQPRETAK